MTATFVCDARSAPFAHSTALAPLPAEVCEALLQWFETDAPWALRVASFYEQWEIHLGRGLPPSAAEALSDAMVERLVAGMLKPIGACSPLLTEVTAHKLIPGQTIRIHNDHLNEGETQPGVSATQSRLVRRAGWPSHVVRKRSSE